MSVAISDLRDQPMFAEVIADRIWRAWWQQRGTPLATIRGLVQDSLAAGSIPLALVAHEGEAFLGTASVIACDLAERPQLTPWVAAVWVEPQHRSRSVASSLIGRSVDAAFGLGARSVYLCARRDLEDFYRRRSWDVIEQDVGPRRLTVFARHRTPAEAGSP